MFSGKFCKISKNTFSYRTGPVAAYKMRHNEIFVFDEEDAPRYGVIQEALSTVFKNLFPTKNIGVK